MDTLTFAFSNLQVTGDVSLGLLPLKRKMCLIYVTVIGQPPVTPIYCSLVFGFWASTNCAITIIKALVQMALGVMFIDQTFHITCLSLQSHLFRNAWDRRFDEIPCFEAIFPWSDKAMQEACRETITKCHRFVQSTMILKWTKVIYYRKIQHRKDNK